MSTFILIDIDPVWTTALLVSRHTGYMFIPSLPLTCKFCGAHISSLLSRYFRRTLVLVILFTTPAVPIWPLYLLVIHIILPISIARSVSPIKSHLSCVTPIFTVDISLIIYFVRFRYLLLADFYVRSYTRHSTRDIQKDYVRPNTCFLRDWRDKDRLVWLIKTIQTEISSNITSSILISVNVEMLELRTIVLNFKFWVNVCNKL